MHGLLLHIFRVYFLNFEFIKFANNLHTMHTHKRYKLQDSNWHWLDTGLVHVPIAILPNNAV